MARPDDAEFERLIEPYRGELHAYCYWMSHQAALGGVALAAPSD